MKTCRLAELERAIERFYKADKKARKNAHLLISSSITTKKASDFMEALQDAKENLFRVFEGKK